MSLYLFNTLSGKKEEFKPITPGEVGMYNCGPTVYDYAHIGNLRAYVFADILRRTLEYNGYKIKQVMNITDVGHLTSDADDGDDKMVRALKREGLPLTLEGLKQVAEKYTAAFNKDLKELNILLPHDMPRASDHIPEDIELIKKLEENGFVYKASDGVYFDTAKFPDYGKLGHINLKGQLAGVRVAISSEKKNPADFSLWKISPNDIGWPSPWGKGFPGWHIECSAMSRKYLGQPFDIHTGGIDHIPVHHNNEIAQSEAAFGQPLANYWMHSAFVKMPKYDIPIIRHLLKEKMAKSEENFLTLNLLKEKEILPLAYRYWLLRGHYRTTMVWSDNSAEAAASGYRNLLLRINDLQKMNLIEKYVIDRFPKYEPILPLQEYKNKFENYINDDLHTPKAIVVLDTLLADMGISHKEKLDTVYRFDSVLGLELKNQAESIKKELTSSEIPPFVAYILKERDAARGEKNWKRADELREEIKKLGFSVQDTGEGQKVEKI